MEQNERKEPEQPGQPVQWEKRLTGGHSGNRAETTAAPASLLPTLLNRLEQHRAYLSPHTSRDELIAALNSREWHVRAAAVKALAASEMQAPLGLLASALHDEHPVVRAAAARAWGNLGNFAPLDPLIAALDDPAWQVREVAALTMGDLAEKGQRIPATPLVKTLRDEDATVREAAAMALRQARLDGVVTGTTQPIPTNMGGEAGWQENEQASMQFQNASWKTYSGDTSMKETPTQPLYENSTSQPAAELPGQMGPTREYRRERPRISRRRILVGLGIGTAGAVALGTAASYLLFSGDLAKFVGGSASPDTATPEPTTPAPTSAVSRYDQWVQTHGIMFGFDPQHTGFNPYESVLTSANVPGLTQAWYSNAMKGNVFSSPSVSGGLVYIGSLDGRLYAIDAATGNTRWASDRTGSSATSNASTPAVINGTVYICLQDHRLYAFDALGGQLRWNSPAGHVVGSSPIVADGVIYVTGKGRVYAFDANSGQPRWVSASPGINNSDFPPVAVANGVIYVSMSGSGAGAGQIYAYDVTTGHNLWVSDLVNGGTDINSSPTVANGLVYIGSGNGGVVAFNATNGRFRWGTPATAGSTGSSPAVANGVVYLAEDRVYAFDAVTGHQRWVTNPLGAYNSDSPVVANGIVYVCSAGDNSVYALDTASGHTLWTSPPANNQVFTAPAVADGVVFMASEDGALYAFSLSR
ncbi:MAG TPA: PQQ-binding-like beta-propeller repeat protein [Ktedonobacteraceae bacterium]